MTRSLLFLFLASTLLFSACGHEETSDEEAAYTVSVDEVVNEFLDDQEAANAKYIDQIIEVKGPLMELNKENGMITGIKLSSDDLNIVNCTFQHPVEPETIGEGEVTVKGVCSGFLGDASSMLPGGTVELKRAALVE